MNKYINLHNCFYLIFNKNADQTAHLYSLLNAFVFPNMKS